VSFEVRRFGIRWVTAHFQVVNGDFVLDRQGSASRVNVNVATASVDCDDPGWNERLRSKEWLDTQQYPRMVYQSEHIEIDDGAVTASGHLTLRGITQSVVLDVNLLDCHAASSCQFAAHARVKRSEYGLPHGFWTGGDQVDIVLSGTAVRQPM
jgi:polyisoprenoid-binding protein YceI